MAKFAVFGNPVTHSLSPQIHHEFAKQAKLDLTYEKIEPPRDQFATALTQFCEQGGQGCNVTAPFKEEAYRLCTKVGSHAETAKSVNCIEFLSDGTLYGDNFDGVGLIQDLIHNKQRALAQHNILLIGAGGAARGIIEPLLSKAPQTLTLINRTFNKAQHLAQEFSHLGPITAISITDLPNTPFDLIINATSAGHTGQFLELPNTLIAPHSACYDLSYGKAANPFLNWAHTQGCHHIFDGSGMLVEQAAASFYLWTGFYPNTNKLIKKLFSTQPPI